VQLIVRRSLASVAMLGVFGIALLPPEHVHSQREQNHHAQSVHRHFEPHHPAASDPGIDHPDDHGEHHDDDEALWLDSWFILPASPVHAYPVDQFLHEDPLVAEAMHATRSMVPSFTPESVHDPPWRSSYGLRAPPPPARLA
jgi:hypothetical protein